MGSGHMSQDDNSHKEKRKYPETSLSCGQTCMAVLIFSACLIVLLPLVTQDKAVGGRLRARILDGTGTAVKASALCPSLLETGSFALGLRRPVGHSTWQTAHMT